MSLNYIYIYTIHSYHSCFSVGWSKVILIKEVIHGIQTLYLVFEQEFQNRIDSLRVQFQILPQKQNRMVLTTRLPVTFGYIHVGNLPKLKDSQGRYQFFTSFTFFLFWEKKFHRKVNWTQSMKQQKSNRKRQND